MNECIINLNTYWVCIYYGFGEWKFGKQWIVTNKSSLNITSKEECESLSLCQVNNTLKNASCDSYNCVGRSYSCVNS